MIFYILTHFSVEVTPRKKHKKDKHKSGEEESGNGWDLFEVHANKV